VPSGRSASFSSLAARWARTSPIYREGVLSAVIASFVGTTLVLVAPPGGDLAAHAYLRSLFLRHGFTLWDNFWYAGRYSFITYSVVYYPLAAVLGIKLLAVVSVAAAGFGFAVVVGREWGITARLSSRVFAVVWVGVVLAGTFPFALGAAFALLAVWAVQASRNVLFALLALLALAASPLAFVLLVLVVLAMGLDRRPSWTRLRLPAIAISALTVIGVVLWRLFPAGGHYPFSVLEFSAAFAFFAAGVALTWRNEQARALRWVFVVNLVACVAAFLVPSALGENIARLRLASVPIAILALSLRRWRPRIVTVAALLLAVSWNASPIAANFLQGNRDVSANPAYWQTTIRYLHAHLGPSYRVEVVDTVDHWEAAYLPPAGIPIARGWFRQDDVPFNNVLYGRRLTGRAYLHWLRVVGVSWVVLTSAPPDYSARGEAALLRSGRSGLQPVLRTSTTTIFAVPSPRKIVTGPGAARVVALHEARVTLELGSPGTYRVAIRYAPYWRSSQGCVTRARDGMLSLHAPSAGQVSLAFDLDPSRALAILGGASPPRCHD
jgi:hypothetical protein